MYPPSKSSSKAPKSRLGWKAAGLFLGTFLAVFIALFFLDLLQTMGEKAIVNAATSNQAAAVAIDPKLESDLAKVLERTDSQNTADIKNPFADTTGISGKYNSTTVSGAVSSNNTARTATPGGGQTTTQRNQTQQQTVPGRNVTPGQTVTQTPQQSTLARLQLREERMRLGMDPGPEAAAYAIDDLLPVGVVSGGDGKDEVMFYSASTCRVVSFPIGTQFFDGWFDSRREEGVVFGFFDQYRTMRMRAWGRSVTQGCSQQQQQGLLEQTSPNQALTTTRGGD